MIAEEQLKSAIDQCCGGVGEPFSDDTLNAIRYGSENNPENTSPYDEEKLVAGVEAFCEKHQFLKELL